MDAFEIHSITDKKMFERDDGSLDFLWSLTQFHMLLDFYKAI